MKKIEFEILFISYIWKIRKLIEEKITLFFVFIKKLYYKSTRFLVFN